MTENEETEGEIMDTTKHASAGGRNNATHTKVITGSHQLLRSKWKSQADLQVLEIRKVRVL